MLRYYQSYNKLKPHGGYKKLYHRLGFVSVLTHEPQLDIDVLKVYNESARHVHHIITIQQLLVRLISDILIILLKVTKHFYFIFLFHFFFNLPMCTPWCNSVYAATPLITLIQWGKVHPLFNKNITMFFFA